MKDVRKISLTDKASLSFIIFSLLVSLGFLFLWVVSSDTGEFISGRMIVLGIFVFFGLPSITIASLIGLLLGVVSFFRSKSRIAIAAVGSNLVVLFLAILVLFCFFKDEIKWRLSDTYRLQTAIEEREYNKIQRLFEKGADVNQVSSDKLPLLLQAIEDCDKPILDLIMEYSPDMRIQSKRPDSVDFTALHFLARQKAEGNWSPLETAVIFLSHGVDPDIIGVQQKSYNDKQKVTALKLAYLYDNQPMFRLLLEASTNVNLVYEENRLPHKPNLGTDTLLKIAIEKNDLSMVKTLVAYKADLFYAEKGHRRSLFAFATKNASLEIIQFLLEAYPFLLTERKEFWLYEVPLNAAAKNDRIDVLHCLFSKGMDINQVDSSGRSPLHYAESREMVDFMISQGLDVNQRDQAGNTPLHRIANQRNPDVIKALLEYGADPRLQNNVGMNPLHFVTYPEDLNKETAVALIEAGASVHTQDHYGRSFISKLRSAEKRKERSKRHREIKDILTDLRARENDNESKE